ncbi:hypothetical protein N7461_004436 [Penicillium sp. DV-2018c]|nr:hypothetical protein N7461_004436 [Penicillium sp. DV-2018c]
MARDPPPFSGAPGENAEHYVLQCKYAWIGVTLEEKEKKQMQGVTLWQGLRGAALDFASSLSPEVKWEFDQLSQRLIDRFPFKKRNTTSWLTLWNQVTHLCQGERSLEDYFGEVQNIAGRFARNEQTDLARAMIAGLTDPTLKTPLSLIVGERTRENKPITIQEVIDIVETGMNVKHSTTPYGPPRSETEQMTAALAELTKAMKEAIIGSKSQIQPQQAQIPR